MSHFLKRGLRAGALVLTAVLLAACNVDWPDKHDNGRELASAPADLTWLRVRGIDDAAISQLGRFPDARFLDLHGGWKRLPQRVTHVGFRKLARLSLRQLEHVNVGRSHMDDEALAALADVPGLEKLALVYCEGFTPTGVAALAHAPRLWYLDIRGCAHIDDVAIDALCSLERLRVLSIAGTSISAEGVSRLRSCLPDAEVSMTLLTCAQCSEGGGISGAP